MSVTADPLVGRPITSHFLAGGGETGERMRRLDWSRSPLGAPEGWPQSLKTIVRVMLDSRYAMWMLWGPEMTFFCNDAYLPTVGLKREWVLGARADEVWEEIWPDIGPRIDHVLTHGEATWDEGLRLYLERSGFPEETYHTFSYSPVYDDHSRIAGMLCVVTEVTERVIGERRLKLLRDLGIRAITMQSIEDTCRRACEVLAQYPLDVSFAAFYLIRPGGSGAVRVAQTRTLPEAVLPAQLPVDADEPWPVGALSRSGQSQELPDLPARGLSVAAGPWSDAVQHALLLPLAGVGPEALNGFIIAGASPRRLLDDGYRAFFELIAGQVGAALADAQANEAERRRAEALAEIDRAKTVFFSNISHEFRTPLTLLLGPLEDALAAGVETLPQHREGLHIAHRNGMRLLKLVNTLLDFSRIEAGRAHARCELTDLASLTRDLLSLFRSAIDKAGLCFTIDLDPPEIQAWIDRGMWENVVLNLVSNAFKFTLEGEIAVTLRREGGEAVLAVSDTGIGIPREALPQLFERFYRVPGAQGRTDEGSGIGLALVAELVKLHGGRIAVDSEPGRGSRFEVRVPLGDRLLPADGLPGATAPACAPTPLADSYIEEALGWRRRPPAQENAAPPTGAGAAPRPRVLLADDNADMRDYVTRLLSPHFDVTAVADGLEALEVLERVRPDLVLSDVMMPRLDGHELLKAIRARDDVRDLPVILLSARAAEEAKVEGLEAGADDYLIKPFAAQELVARIASHIAMVRQRREANAALSESEQRFRVALDSSAVGFTVLAAVRDGAGAIRDFRWQYLNRAAQARIGRDAGQLLGRRVLEVFPHHWEIPGLFEALVRVVESGVPEDFEVPVSLHDAPLWFHNSVAKLDDGVVVWFADITALKRIEAQLREEDRKKDEFLAVLAHELRNPLAPIRQAAALARSPQASAEQRQWSQEVIERQVRHMARLLDDLLDISRITRGRLELRRERTDIKTVVDAAVEAARPLIERRRHALEVTLTEPAPVVEGDVMRLSQVLSNLLTNAAKYTEPGGRIALRVERDAEAGVLILRVTDNGIGIPPASIPGLFEMFSQLGAGPDHAEGGLGIGLALARGVMALHGGSVEAHSDGIGRGSEFIVRMPLAPLDARSLRRGGDVPVRSAAALRVLVADDNRDAAESLSALLQLEGHEVCTAFDGNQAVAAAATFRPRLMLVDIGMPGRSGYEVAAHIRNQLADAPITLVAVTGWGQDSDKQRALDAGFDRHLTKPVDYEALRALLASLSR